MSSKERNGISNPQGLNTLHKQKIMTTEEENWNEIIQDVIDRLLYLPTDEVQKYKNTLNVLNSLHPIEMVVSNGVRIYETIKNL